MREPSLLKYLSPKSPKWKGKKKDIYLKKILIHEIAGDDAQLFIHQGSKENSAESLLTVELNVQSFKIPPDGN